MPEQAAVSSLVVVGASAGGVVALSTLVATMPADFPAPVVIAQHLAPTQPSVLADILARHSRLPELLRGADRPVQRVEKGALLAVLQHLREARGVDFTPYKRATILRRVQRRMAATGTPDLPDLAPRARWDLPLRLPSEPDTAGL